MPTLIQNCKARFGKWMVAFGAVCSLATGVEATPDAAIVLSDQIVGTTSDSFFVIRTTTLRPPSYYEYTMRVELVELSNASGQIKQSCLVRETEYDFTLGAAQEVWQQTESVPVGCQIFKVLSDRGANYVEPEIVGPDVYEFQLSAEGISTRRADQSDPSMWRLVLTLEEIQARVSRMTSISTSTLPFQTDGAAGSPVSVSFMDDHQFSEPLFQICELRSEPARSLRLKWYFLRFICWSGEGDVDGANFYLPIPDTAVDTEN